MSFSLVFLFQSCGFDRDLFPFQFKLRVHDTELTPSRNERPLRLPEVQ
jgi:hypothetical protein